MSTGFQDRLNRAIEETRFIDTHEHLVEEEMRTQWRPHPLLPCDDWALLFSHYLDSDLRVAGMAEDEFRRLVAPDGTPEAKWRILEPYWPAVKHTGYGQAVRIAIRSLYGVDELSGATVGILAERYRATVKPGFYETVLRRHAGIEVSQVNSLEAPFAETRQPDLLQQDLSLVHFSPSVADDLTKLGDPFGLSLRDLADYHRVIDAWFAKYGPYAVAVKSQAAYWRGLDYDEVAAEEAEPILRKRLNGEPVTEPERKALDDHVFWYAVGKAAALGLPVKLHTGYYAGHNSMPLGRLAANPSQACELCRRSPDTRFVFMHMGYPFQDQMIALAKQWSNAYVDMCWAWVMNPSACERFVRDFLLAAPANKLLLFGGDYIPVEPVVGHAALARRGLARALTRLAADGWMTETEAVEAVEPLMRGNAAKLFRVKEKVEAMRRAPWLT